MNLTMTSAPAAIILAAGKGTRMNSDLPKVAHVVAGRPMIEWVVDACVSAGCGRIVLVVGHRQEVVRSIFEGWADDEVRLEFAVQQPQLGTGHAVRCAEALLHEEAARPGHDVFVLAGDGPLIRAQTLAGLLARHRAARASASLATAVIDDPSGYGRIVRDAGGRFCAIVEEKNATPAQRAIREINPSYYCFDARALFECLEGVTRDAVSGEYYITDVPALLLARGERVEVIDAVPPEDVLSINTPAQLQDVDRVLRARQGHGPVAASGTHHGLGGARS